mmetsp:Transcript_30167/g.84270  ORF Transcript_30167/g.84270 Transcript_30167/m.84270 type:complete len:593 (+) Transcript_30167:130-1908(+)|eukprot:CAMPEP_0119119756 /NCGR_PEP_ID=MMETSP1310-20130426/1097_1 /TAXON_ID=464262 /ORGANISM="Genus nov. species nov., Strain RCC2339" /LENGTH=592 /DNA_ID=CAMNT_0007109203 /DNA_START=117 /DNA_END=1895 /DNA_ORIENTATION=+
MSFWRTFGFHTVSAVENILEKESFTLEELLDEEELLQECKGQNQKLLDYLLQTETLQKLLFYLTTDPEPDAESKTRHKYPYLACEILCLEVWDICEAIYENTNLLDQLWAFLDQEPPLSSQTASYVCRVAGVLLQRKIAESFNYLKTKENMAQKFLKHIGNSAVNELLLKIVQCDETAEGSGIVKWLTDQNLVELLVGKLDPTETGSVHEHVGQALVDMIPASTGAPSPLMEQLENEETFEKLFKYILAGLSNSSLYYGLNVIIEVVKKDSMEQLTSGSVEELPGHLKACVGNIKALVEYLRNPGPRKVMTSFGEITPIGTHRLKVVEFFSALLSKQNKVIDTQLLDQGVFDICLDLFFGYYWNNFLHAIVTDMLWMILDGQEPDHTYRLIDSAKLLDRICDASEGNQADVEKPKGCARGYMGFINRVSNRVVGLQKSDEKIKELCDAHERWNSYVEGALKDQNAYDNILLGGQKPSAEDSVQNSSGDEDGGMAGMANNELVNVFTQYLVKQGFTNDFPKDFLGEEEEDFDVEDEEQGSLVLDKEFDEIQQPYSTEDSDEDGEEVDGDDIIEGEDEDEESPANESEAVEEAE